MSRYIPNTVLQQNEMLEDIGLKTIDDLFAGIPDNIKLNRELKLPDALSENELIKHMNKLSNKNANLDNYVCFLGAGVYDHYIPSVVNHMISRQEFYTAYTPYQPEISQGTLQAIFEYQTMICELTGMDVANASVYDGATAFAEAASMACHVTGRDEILAASTVHPENMEVLKTYARFNNSIVKEVGYNDGTIDLEDLERKVSDTTAAVIIQSPNFFGLIEHLDAVGELAHRKKALFIVSVDPVSLGVLKPPGEFGADIVVGEGQSLGNPLSFGGPYLGFFSSTKKLMRKMPGRIVGQTTDRFDNRGFVLTMQAREQHIRREKATSNICTNQALNALAATVYLTLLGRKGLREVAELCLFKSHYAYEQLLKTGKFTKVFSATFFKEFVLKSKVPVEELNRSLLEKNIIGGYNVGKNYAEIENGWLLAVTEKRTKEEIDMLVNVVSDRKAGA
jgi:glycine dehydrogenase subunit 1